MPAAAAGQKARGSAALQGRPQRQASGKLKNLRRSELPPSAAPRTRRDRPAPPGGTGRPAPRAAAPRWCPPGDAAPAGPRAATTGSSTVRARARRRWRAGAGPGPCPRRAARPAPPCGPGAPGRGSTRPSSTAMATAAVKSRSTPSTDSATPKRASTCARRLLRAAQQPPEHLHLRLGPGQQRLAGGHLPQRAERHRLGALDAQRAAGTLEAQRLEGRRLLGAAAAACRPAGPAASSSAGPRGTSAPASARSPPGRCAAAACPAPPRRPGRDRLRVRCSSPSER